MGKPRSICPRCGGFLETLQSYAHCSSCLYYEDYWFDSDSAFYQAMKDAKEMTQIQDDVEIAEEEIEEEVHDEKECA